MSTQPIPYTGGRAIVTGCRFTVPGTGASAVTTMQCDDGSDVSAISAAVATALGATPSGREQITGVDGQPFWTPVYTLDLSTPDGDVFSWPFWQIGEGGIGGLIGQDLLRPGLFEETPAGFWLQIGTTAPPTAPRASSSIPAEVAVVAGTGLALYLVLTWAHRGGASHGRRRVA